MPNHTHQTRPAIQLLALLFLLPALNAQPAPKSELIFPLETWHNHSSSIVETPGGGLFVVWFHGSGERQSDDVVIRAARKPAGATEWSEPFLLADQPDFPDTNCMVFVDSHQRLWLFWPTIAANEWHTAILNYKVSSDWSQRSGPPIWDREGIILLNHDLDAFEAKVRAVAEPLLAQTEDPDHQQYLTELIQNAGDKYFSRMGWMTRTHALELPTGRLLLPLYSDGYSFGLVALSDDGGRSWRPSEPIVGMGSIQPSLVRRDDGTIVAYMRDNGPAPKRIHVSESPDGGESWGPVHDSSLPNPGASVEAIRLQDGRWLMVYNDTERGRHSLAVALSSDEGRTWGTPRHIERHEPGAVSVHYPSVIQGRDGTVHVTYSYFLNDRPAGQPRKSIKYAVIPPNWLVVKHSNQP